ncbi:MAG TPA: TetR/AcrR family transcriptional regulator [Spirochaetia bacterium]|nr:TetR/AcrR family transcriptional regulator [Spirochaetia bacterium]
MKRRGRQGKTAAETAAQKKIVEAAIACIDRDGLSRVTIRGIAREAGVNSAAISYYFRSKERLIEEALKTTLANAFGDWEVMLDGRGEDLESRLGAVLREALEGALRYPGIVKAHLYDTFVSGAANTLFIRRFSGFLSLLARELQSRFPRRSAREIGADTVQLISAVLLPGFLPQLFRNAGGFDLADHGERERYVDGVLRRFLSQPTK